MNIYWVRHGKTEFNKERRLQGWSDSPLLKEDKSYEEAAKKLKGIKFSYTCSSDLNRAVKTKQNILNILNLPIDNNEFSEFREISFGLLENESIEYVKETYSDMWALFKSKSDDYQPVEFDAESINDLRKRVYKKLDELKKEFSDEDNILIVSHGTTIAVINDLQDVPENGSVTVQKY